jgi:hypothetical protein
VVEQNRLLEEMLARAEVAVKELGEQLGELQARQDSVGLEGAILRASLKLGGFWLGMILSAWAIELAEEAGTRRQCACGGVARWVSLRRKTILTLLGKVTYKRVYYHCKECGHGEGLGDRAWGLMKTRTSPAVKQLLAYLSATTVGFATVAQNVCRTLRWPKHWLSGKQVQRLAEPLGSRLSELEATKIAGWWAKLTAGLSAELAIASSESESESESERPTRALSSGRPGAKLPTRLYVEMDGILARLRGSEDKGSDVWREVKVGALFWAEPGRHASKLAELVGTLRARLGRSVRVWVDRPTGQVSYVATLLPAAGFGVRLYAEAVLRGLERASEVVILGDGALWIWKLAEEHFPGAIQILDFHHAKQWVWNAAHAVWGEGSAKAKEWAEAQIEQHLIKGDVVGLVEAIAGLPQVAPLEGQSRSVPEHAMEYFQHNAERMRYPEYRAKGLEIGSGIVESSARRVVGVRCKQPGMRWCEEGLSAIVHLRAHVLSNRYDSAIASLPTAA